MTLKRGTLKAFDGATYMATVEVTGSLNTWLGGVAVARNIAAGELVNGRSVAIVFFDAGNPVDAVVFAVWT